MSLHLLPGGDKKVTEVDRPNIGQTLTGPAQNADRIGQSRLNMVQQQEKRDSRAVNTAGKRRISPGKGGRLQLLREHTEGSTDVYGF